MVQVPLRPLERHGYHPRWISETELVIDGREAGRPALYRIEATTGAVLETVPIESTCVNECAAWQWQPTKWVMHSSMLVVISP